jgi:signal transduction histidine kinase
VQFKFSKLIKSINEGRLRNKIILFFIILAITPVLLLGGATLYLLELSHRQDVSSLELQLLGQKIEEVEKFFTDTLGILELQVGFSQISEIALDDQVFLLESLLLENTALEEVSFINLEGKETARRARFSQDSTLSDVSLLQKFKTAKQGDNFMSDVFQTLSGPLITITTPVRNRDGVMIQLLSAEVNLSSVARSIEGAHVGASGYAILFDQSRNLITRGGGGEISYGKDFGKFSRIQKIASGFTLDGLDSQDRYKSPFSGQSVVGAGKQIPSLGWILLVEWPISEADTVLVDVKNQILQITFVSIIAVLLLALLFANRLVKPIKLLERRATQIQKGEFEKKVNIKTNDELQELGESFNKMSHGLKRLQELKDEFVFIAAHELRAPVAVIRGYVSMVTDGSAGKISKEARNYLSQVDKANKNLVKLVEDLLQVARSDAGRIEVVVKNISAQEIVQEIVDGHQVLAQEKSISLKYEPGENVPNVIADPQKLKEVITNFVNNAVKYTLSGGNITVSHEIKGGKLITHVKDSGVGLSKEQQEKLFQKFYRAKQKGVEEVLGTGLGLWITKELIGRMKGETWATSEEGKGSIFSFSLPIAS